VQKEERRKKEDNEKVNEKTSTTRKYGMLNTIARIQV
jgi:hypothetical protein